jgi:hypothetical protein
LVDLSKKVKKKNIDLEGKKLRNKKKIITLISPVNKAIASKKLSNLTQAILPSLLKFYSKLGF